MKFIALILYFVLDHYMGDNTKLSFQLGFKHYLERWSAVLKKSSLWHSWTGVISALLPPALVVWLLQLFFYERFYCIFSIVLDVLVLFCCLNIKDLWDAYQKYQTAIAEQDQHSAAATLANLLGCELVVGENPHRALTEIILVGINQRLFAILFWFIVFGPVGAVIYRCVTLLKEHAKDEQNGADFFPITECIQDILDWLPARLLTLSYAMVGDFVATFSYWFDHALAGYQKNRQLLVHCGLAAILADEKPLGEKAMAENNDVVALIQRTLLVWCVIIGLTTCALWICR